MLLLRVCRLCVSGIVTMMRSTMKPLMRIMWVEKTVWQQIA